MYRHVEVGGLFKEGMNGISQYQEGVKFDIADEGCYLQYFMDKPAEEEIEDLKYGKLKIGFFRKNEVMMILTKFGDMPFCDAPYSVHKSDGLTELQELEPSQGYSLNICLVDSSTGIVKALRLIGLPNRFSKDLKKEVEKQKLIPYGNFDKQLNEIYKNYQTKDLVKFADIYNC